MSEVRTLLILSLLSLESALPSMFQLLLLQDSKDSIFIRKSLKGKFFIDTLITIIPK